MRHQHQHQHQDQHRHHRRQRAGGLFFLLSWVIGWCCCNSSHGGGAHGFLLVLSSQQLQRRSATTTTTTTTRKKEHRHHVTARLKLSQNSQNKSNNNNENSNQQQDQGSPLSRSSSRPLVPFSDSKTLSVGNDIFSWIISDVGGIVLGVVGLLLVLMGRVVVVSSSFLGSEDAVAALGEETRVNLLAVLAAGAVLLNGLSKVDVTVALAETVQLQGTTIPRPVVLSVPQRQQSYLSMYNDSDKDDDHDKSSWQWLMQALLTATPASSVVLLQQQHPNGWSIWGYGGIVPSALLLEEQSQMNDCSCRCSIPLPRDLNTPILNRFFLPKNGSNDSLSETYLPTLQTLPGRMEFLPYLPSNTQAVLLAPFPIAARTSTSTSSSTALAGVLVLGANQSRSFTPRDIAWIQAAVLKVAATE